MYIKQLFITLFCTLAFGAFAQSDIPTVNRLVVDKAGFLSQQEQQALEQQLVEFSNQTANQILVYISSDLGDYDISDFAVRLGEKNKVGQDKSDNGVVIVIKPKTARSRGQAFIAPGYGLEGAIPDITAKQIVENELIPYFKQQQNYQGLSQAVLVIKKLAIGEFNKEMYQKKGKKAKGSKLFSFLLVLIIIIFTMTRKVRRYAGANNLGFLAALTLLSSTTNRHGGHFNSFNSGSGSFGGGSSGGFGGFGGGSFGGGGAGGSW
jgi:uncharacterized protein